MTPKKCHYCKTDLTHVILALVVRQEIELGWRVAGYCCDDCKGKGLLIKYKG